MPVIDIEPWIDSGCPPPLIRNVKDGSVLVLVPGGEFEMGDGLNSSCPKHRVWVDAYYIGVYCVTNRQYARFVREGKVLEPGNTKWKQPELEDHPVTNVSWDDATAYAEWAGCQLPTEAQWERAARGPAGLIYPWGDEWDEKKCRNVGNNGTGQTCAVWEYPAGASVYGTLNQSGNVFEWCRDWYGDYKTDGVQQNPEGPPSSSYRVVRGGCWRSAVYCWRIHGCSSVVGSEFRGAFCGGYGPAYRGDDLGFRLVRTVSLPSATTKRE